MTENVQRKSYIDKEGRLCHEIEAVIIVTDIFKNAIAAKIEGREDEDVVISMPELTKDKESIYEIGERLKIRICPI